MLGWIQICSYFLQRITLTEWNLLPTTWGWCQSCNIKKVHHYLVLYKQVHFQIELFPLNCTLHHIDNNETAKAENKHKCINLTWDTHASKYLSWIIQWQKSKEVDLVTPYTTTSRSDLRTDSWGRSYILPWHMVNEHCRWNYDVSEPFSINHKGTELCRISICSPRVPEWRLPRCSCWLFLSYEVDNLPR